jgi:hypothetical protein
MSESVSTNPATNTGTMAETSKTAEEENMVRSMAKHHATYQQILLI